MSKEKIISLQDCYDIVKKYFKSANTFDILEYEENRCPLHRYGGSCFAIKIKIFLNDAIQEIRLVAKQFKVYKCLTESHQYIFKDLTEEYPHFVLNFIPQLYLHKVGKLAVFEDLLEQGFIFPEFHTTVHIKLTLQILAKYHARNIVYEEEKSQQLGKSYSLMDEYPDLNKGSACFENAWFEARLESLNTAIDLIPENGYLNEDLKIKLRNLINDFLLIMKSGNHFRRILCHGKLWGKSILFKHSKDLTPIQCLFINFEHCHYNSPAIDVLQFICMSANMELRKHQLKSLLQFYYKCFTKELSAKSLKANKILPLKEDFEVALHHYLPVIKVQTICLRQIIWENARKKYSNNEITLKEMYKSDENFKKMVIEDILELKHFLLHPKLTLEDCFSIIENKIRTTSYELVNYQLMPLDKICGFLGDHNRLKIDITTNGQKKTLNLFAKFMPVNDAAVSIATDTGAFAKEMFIYEHFIPMAKALNVEILKDCGIPCYFTRHNDVIVLDDFGITNYSTLEPRQPLSYETVKVIIIKLVKFHVSSIIMEEKFTEKNKSEYRFNDHFRDELREAFFSKTEDHDGIRTMHTAINCVEHELNLFPDLCSPVPREEITAKVKKAYDMLYELVKPSDKFRNVICHGDLWINNIMIQRLNNVTTDCRFIDYQICRYCPPAHDLLCFLHLTTTRSMRKQYLNEWILLYYKEFSEHINNFGYDIENIYPYDTFMESIEYMMPQAVCQTVLYFQMTLTNSDIVKEYMKDEKSAHNLLLGDRRDFINDMVNRDPLFKQRAGESIQDLREMCLKYF